MTHNIGLSTKVVQDRPIREAAEIASQVGYTGLEIFGVLNHLPLDTTVERGREYRRLFDDLGLRTITICSYVGGFAEGSDAEAEREIAAFRHYLALADVLGCSMVRLWGDRLGRSIVQPRDDHFSRAAHYLARCADLAAESGARVLLENHLAMTISVDMTLRLLRAIDRPNVVVNFDPGNMYLAGEACGTAETLRLRPHIGNVQVKEVARGVASTAAQSGHPTSPATIDATLSRGGTYEVLLGEGTLDHLAYLRPLAATSYDGFYMVECHRTPDAAWPSDRIAAYEHRALSELLDRATGAAHR